MDQSLKERLIGAAVLVGLAVWLIPWVLDGPVPDSEIEAAQVPAAERSTPLQTRTIRLDEEPDRPAPTVPDEIEENAVVQPAVQAAVQANPGDSPATGAPAAPEAVPVEAVPVEAVPVEAAPVAATPPGANPAAQEPAVAEATVAAVSETAATGAGPAGAAPARVAEPSENSSGSSDTPPLESGWLVQVGSFGAEENARRQAARVATLGYTAKLYTHTSGGRLMYRVRVGPMPSREGADDIASSLTAQGFVAQVVSSD